MSAPRQQALQRRALNRLICAAARLEGVVNRNTVRWLMQACRYYLDVMDLKRCGHLRDEDCECYRDE